MEFTSTINSNASIIQQGTVGDYGFADVEAIYNSLWAFAKASDVYVTGLAIKLHDLKGWFWNPWTAASATRVWRSFLAPLQNYAAATEVSRPSADVLDADDYAAFAARLPR